MGRILFIASEYPYPPNHGSAVHTWALIKDLKHMGFGLDLVVTVRGHPEPADIDAVKDYVESLLLVERRRGIFAALSSVPFQIRSREGLRNIPLTKTYDAVILKSDYVASILDNPSLKASVQILVADGEARYFRELGRCASGWIERLFYRIESLRFLHYSPRIRTRCDALWFVSNWERTLHLRKHPEDSFKSIFLPPDPGVKGMSPYVPDAKQVLFIGSLAISLNVEGLIWYLKYVHPTLSRAPEYSLIIAGRTDGRSIIALENITRQYSNVFFYPNPQELDVFYKRAAVFVNPVLRGAGIKLKTIQALQAGVPVVSTSVGMEGTGLIDGAHILVADSAEMFADRVWTLLRDRELGGRLVGAAQSYLAQTYDHERNIRLSLSQVLPVDSAAAGGVHGV